MNTGITRKLDDLGRVVLPSELRKSCGIGPKTSVLISFNDGKVSLEPAKEGVIGVVRETDALGRIVIPIEVRRQMGLAVHPEVRFGVEDGKIIVFPAVAVSKLDPVEEALQLVAEFYETDVQTIKDAIDAKLNG